jgi:hypothetical protein
MTLQIALAALCGALFVWAHPFARLIMRHQLGAFGFGEREVRRSVYIIRVCAVLGALLAVADLASGQ